MARWRAVHPKISQSLDVEQMSEWAQLLWDRVIVNGDDWGRMRGEAALVKAACKPLSARPAKDFEAALVEMESAGLIQRYTVGRQVFLQIGQWERYQHSAGIHKRTLSDFPACDDGTPYAASDTESSRKFPGSSRNIPSHSTSQHDTSQHTHTSPDGAESPGGDGGEPVAAPARSEFQEWLDEFNAFTLSRGLRKRPWPATEALRAKFKTRRQTWSYEQLIQAAMYVHQDAYLCGDNPRHRVYCTPEYILRDDNHVADFQEAPEKKPTTGPPPRRPYAQATGR